MIITQNLCRERRHSTSRPGSGTRQRTPSPPWATSTESRWTSNQHDLNEKYDSLRNCTALCQLFGDTSLNDVGNHPLSLGITFTFTFTLSFVLLFSVQFQFCDWLNKKTVQGDSFGAGRLYGEAGTCYRKFSSEAAVSSYLKVADIGTGQCLENIRKLINMYLYAVSGDVH